MECLNKYSRSKWIEIKWTIFYADKICQHSIKSLNLRGDKHNIKMNNHLITKSFY